MAETVEEMQVMINEVTEAIHEVGYKWKDGDSKVVGMGELAGDLIQLIICEQSDIVEVKQVQVLEILGEQIDETGSSYISKHHRLQKADRMFSSHYPTFRKKGHEHSIKLDAWRSTIMAVATYGCGGWHLTGEMLSKLRTWELQHLTKIFPSKHQPTRAEYMI